MKFSLIILLIPFVLQAVAIFFDEYYFHRKRGLPLWERIGHPVDTLSAFACYAFISFNQPTELNIYIYVGLCAFSSLLVTKDEFVHTEKCEAKENWLHAILFILHPVTFFCAGLLWKEQVYLTYLFSFMVGTFLFMFYQIVYWSLLEKSK